MSSGLGFKVYFKGEAPLIYQIFDNKNKMNEIIESLQRQGGFSKLSWYLNQGEKFIQMECP